MDFASRNNLLLLNKSDIDIPSQFKPNTYYYEVVPNNYGWDIRLNNDSKGKLFGIFFDREYLFNCKNSILKKKINSEDASSKEKPIVEIKKQELSIRDQIEKRRLQQKRPSYENRSSQRKKSKTTFTKTKVTSPQTKPIVEKSIISEEKNKDRFVISSSEDEQSTDNKVEMSDPESEPHPDSMDVDSNNNEQFATKCQSASTVTSKIQVSHIPRKPRKKIDKVEMINGKVHVKEIWITDDEAESSYPTNEAKSIFKSIATSKPLPSAKKQSTLGNFFKKQ
eukprot:NODE_155_length_15238_cov_1.162560.p7 type:complete len:280 gc:universal NODE_155_length_15238_cov_1.162560:8159-7320(-)